MRYSKRVRLVTASALLGSLLLMGCQRSDDRKDAPGQRQTSQAPASPHPGAATDAAVAPDADSAAAAARPRGPDRPLNVLLLTIDSMRADMPWNGYPRAIAPNLSKLAEKSVVYENAYSVSSYTAKSVAAILTGRWPSTLYRTGWFFAGYAKDNLFFTEALQEHGARTISWHGHAYFGRGKGLDQGFDEWHLVPGIRFDAQTDPNVTSDKMTELGIKLLKDPANTGKQFFAWAHYMDPHDEYVQHKESPEFGKKNRDRYDSEIFYTDLWIQKLLDFCAEQPWWKDTAVIISADHGEAFGEHNMYKHAFQLWEVLIRIPLVVYAPGITPKRITERRSTIDLAPTIMDLMRQPQLPTFVGKSLVPELYGAVKPDDREPIVAELAEDSHNPQVRAIVQGDYKLIVYGDPTVNSLLFNIKSDPGETKDLAKAEPDKHAAMLQVYRDTYAKIPTIQPYGGMKLKSGKEARGPAAAPKTSADAGTPAPKP